MLKELRRIFLVGIFTLAPLALTIYIIGQLFVWFDSFFHPAFIATYLGRDIPGMGILFGIFIILVVGLLAPSIFGKQFMLMTERIVERLPLVKMIYSGTKQIFDSFSQSGSNKFSRVVMIRFPHSESYSLGFVTHDCPASWVPGKDDHKLVVFVPTTPNPTSGYLVFVPEAETIPIKISVEEALKLIISGGLVRPPGLGSY